MNCELLTVKFNTIIQYNLQYNFIAKCQSLIARGMFCGAKYIPHTFTPIKKHLITTTANVFSFASEVFTKELSLKKI